MKKKLFVGLAIGLFILDLEGMANAAVIGYVNNPNSNSTDWSAAVTGLGGVINSNVNFDGMSTGTLNGTFYTVSDGVTMSASGNVNGIFNGVGPGQSNTSSPVLNTGEGLHNASNYLSGGADTWNLTVSFNSAVSGFGLSTVDYFGANGSLESLRLQAFSGVNGTGILLGEFNSLNQNYQSNYTYFMGLSSTDNDIMSVVFTDFNGGTGDVIGVDNIMFSGPSSSPVPEPATMLLFGTGIAGLVAVGRRKRS